MRRTLVTIISLALVVGLVAGPAAAGKRKKKAKPIQETFTVQALPFPKLSATGLEGTGCMAGQEGVNFIPHPFEAPFSGTLTATMTGFTGDWDLFLTDESGAELIGSVNDQIQGGAEAVEEVTFDIKKGTTVNIVPCNWLGAPEATVDYVFAP